MNLTADEALARLCAHDHAVLCTVHATRGVDAVPVVFAIEGDHVGIPIDRVKPKAATQLQRERNLHADPRATLLIDHWDPIDWSRLWWVRAELRTVHATATIEAALADHLARKYAQYSDRPFDRILVLQLAAVTGWAGEAGPSRVRPEPGR